MAESYHALLLLHGEGTVLVELLATEPTEAMARTMGRYVEGLRHPSPEGRRELVVGTAATAERAVGRLALGGLLVLQGRGERALLHLTLAPEGRGAPDQDPKESTTKEDPDAPRL